MIYTILFWRGEGEISKFINSKIGKVGVRVVLKYHKIATIMYNVMSMFLPTGTNTNTRTRKEGNEIYQGIYQEPF